MFVLRSVGVCLLLGLWASLSLAQTAPEAPGFRQLDTPVSAGIARQTVEPPEANTCRVTFCTEDLRRVLIHDSKDTLLLDVRSLNIKIDTIGSKPTVTCKLYAGVFEPTGAPTKVWNLSEIRFVDPVDFQKLVDQGTLGRRTQVVPDQETDGADASGTAEAPGTSPAGVNLEGVTPLIPDTAPRTPPANPSRPGTP